MKIAAYKRTFKEHPLHYNLTLWISNCPRKCPNCQTPFLQEDTGEELTVDYLSGLVNTIGSVCDNVIFLGGEQHGEEFIELADWVHQNTNKHVTLYTGADSVPDSVRDSVDYLKLGPYIESKGGLNSPGTNQRMYKNNNGTLTDITSVFWD